MKSLLKSSFLLIGLILIKICYEIINNIPGGINSSTNYDVEVDDEEFNTEKTISKIMNEIKDRKKRRYPSENEMMKVNQRCWKHLRIALVVCFQVNWVEIVIVKKCNLVEIQPVIFFKGDEKPNKLLIET